MDRILSIEINLNQRKNDMRNQIFPAVAVLLAIFALSSCSEDTTTPPANTAPVISSITPDPATVGMGLTSSVTCLASDPDSDPITYAWSSSAGTVTGTGSTIIWTAPSAAGSCTISCTVSDGQTTVNDSVIIAVFEPVIPGTMVTVPGGTFTMGDSYDEGAVEERPLHSVSLDSFRIGKYEVTQSEWAEFMDPAVYDIGSGDNYPVYSVSWFEIIMYCNLKSMDEGLTPCYTILSSTYPTDWPVVPNYSSDQSFPAWNAVECNWSANGYRLPTEAEWEFAARGGAAYTDDYRYSGGQTVEDLAWFGDNAVNGCQIIGTLLPNQLGLYDMSGNQYEFCWAWFAEDYYMTCNNQGTVANPTGPVTAEMRVVKGGGWGGTASNCRVAGRVRDYPVSAFNHTGFRLVRKP